MSSRTVFRALVLSPLLFISTSVFAQSPTDDLGPLPTYLSAEQLESLSYLAPALPDLPQQTHNRRRRLPRIVIPLTPEELAYRDAVRTLGVDNHRFVHCELSSGKSRTGAIVEIKDDGFRLSQGIFGSILISYSELTASPRPSPAVGTHLVNGLKWTGLVAGIVVAIPVLIPLVLPLSFLGILTDC